MRIGAALVLIAVGAILRFAIVTVSSHGVYLHTIGDILMAVGLLGLILWLVIWAPWARRGSSYRQTRYVDEDGYPPSQYPGNYPPSSYRQAEYPPGEYPPHTGPTRVHEEVRYDDR